jgi:DNA-binding PadR family transcriptional regulator
MSVKHGILALLERGPRHGYQLRVEFEEATGTVWPLNIGQVYTTLSRSERDGLVRALPESEEGHRPYEITDAGRAELALWFLAPVDVVDRPRDELAIKLALALTTPGVNVRDVIAAQRVASMQALQAYTRLKVRAGGPDDLAWGLVLDAQLFRIEAEIRWLDHCEGSLVNRSAQPTTPHDAGVNRPAAERTHSTDQTDPAGPGLARRGVQR